MLLLLWCPFIIQKEKLADLQFSSTDYLSFYWPLLEFTDNTFKSVNPYPYWCDHIWGTLFKAKFPEKVINNINLINLVNP